MDLANDTCTNCREDHQVSSDWFRRVLEHLGKHFRNPEFVCEKYHVCILSTNVNQYLAFRPLQRNRWVYEWGAQVRKYNISKSPHSKKPLSSHKTYNCPSYNQVLRKIFVPYTQLFYNTRKTLKTYKKIQPRPSSINKTLMDCY
jgi:hypothetical protein